MIVLFIMDYSGIFNLYGQNYVRRIFNMYRRIDYMAYKDKLDPFCKKVKKVLNEYDIQRLNTINIPASRDTSWFTRTNTTTHQCCESFSENERKIINDISIKLKEYYEKDIGKKLYFMKQNKATIYVYKGNNSKHLWHVDPQNLKEIYNVILCFKKIGNISPLQCKDRDGSINSIHFEPGDVALFNGGTTIHQVPPNDDKDSERYVLSIAFTTSKKISNDVNASNNLCTYIEGGNNITNICKLVMATFLTNFLISKISKVNTINNRFIVGYLTFSLALAKIIPMLNLNVGTGRSSSLEHNVVLLIITIITTLSAKGGSVLFSYYILSDVLFPSSWVAYD